ncbi:MAG: hypothetical protein KF729_15840 [Sandaracinaceae bacterium]|nr:hypothetical protein [Sandaracinaceae bacterium]
MARRAPLALCLTTSLALVACDGAGPPATDAGPEPGLRFTVVTFNTGTTPGLAHDGPPDDGYTQADADVSDVHYGNGLAWLPAIDAARFFLGRVRPDVVAFQEIFHSPDCATVPATARAGFVCEGWFSGAPTVAQTVLGEGYQVACNLGRPDKCVGVRRGFGALRGCARDLCLDGLDGARVTDCGGGSRVGRGVIELVRGGTITVVNVHGSSGIEAMDQTCRTRQFEQVFVDLDGAPAANGAANVVLGDFNTDPARLATGDPSAARLVELVQARAMRFVTPADRRSTPTYAGLFDIDHVISDAYEGDCWAAGVTPGQPPVIDAVYFDHVPIVCELRGDPP